ncbi:MAG: hypothetical protein COW00_09460 [Bdellovibrio sp. CG12_big_fil_rev_8_21_14_0_65_39_13]|nr:MAG: hypothetical protein COW78_15050 [Bdellovibrio sp. CG22_combo_CG10-13_8_21_14_all_39_27]PIQ59646.1 MAG: hypothetical protein COW00_09460 [Bdellovibrio sp. CG12_big_fil_rev_8_21_14_0_65_39_13]PIR33396.1 MAG: hypothetical protein COV37_16580 [Bdellovibrio sp. CG11_big_fil_rev_8_21_14_0_20_39_38]
MYKVQGLSARVYICPEYKVWRPRSQGIFFVSILNRIKIQLKRSKMTIPSRTFVKKLLKFHEFS